MEDQELMKNHSVTFFQNLYKEDANPSFVLETEQTYTRLDQQLVPEMDYGSNERDIKKGFFNIGLLKAHRSDSYLMLFFQSNWETLCESTCSFVHSLWKKAFFDSRC